jgi:lysozyme family protein
MPRIPLTQKLAEEYESLYRSCSYDKDRFDDIDRLVDGLLSHKGRYEAVSDAVGAPWYFVAVIHQMESSADFTRHLHNGDPLTDRTRHVPAGRPKRGSPPFTWEESATDALKLRRIDKVPSWPLARLLYEIEGYNGWGYRLYHPHVLSPYLWSWSNHYHGGKYVADGRWSDTARSRQCGAAVILRRMEERGEISFARVEETLFRYSDGPLPHADELQRFLNRFPGIALRVDGWPGRRTSDAVKKLFGFYLKGDPRRA